jgi:putative FmdB family regulatory protein
LNAVPLYAYRCTQCGHSFEKIQSFSDEPELVCPKCGGVLERPLTAPRLQFKGAGWYVNDYASKSSSAKGDSSASAAGSSDGKPASAESAAAETKKSGDGSAGAAPVAPSGTSSTPASSS